MKIGDFICPAVLAALPAMVFWGGLQDLRTLAAAHPQAVGFGIFAVLGGAAEAWGLRLAGRGYPGPARLIMSALLWGLHGLLASVLYWVINAGVFLSQGLDILPGGGYVTNANPFKAFFSSFFFTGPFFTSLIVCLTLNPVLLALQRLVLTFWDFRSDKGRWPSLGLASWKADWPAFIHYQLTGVLLIRVPLMTVVFMLPANLWLVTAAWAWALITVLEGLSGRKERRKAPGGSVGTSLEKILSNREERREAPGGEV